MKNNNLFISQILKELGITEYGFAKAEHELGYAVSIVVPLSKYIIKQIDTEPTFEYFHHYRTVNTFIDNTMLKCGLKIADAGYDYLCVPASQSTGGYKAYYSHKAAARGAGLGYIGKNCLFISEKYGSAVRLGTILTNMPFETKNPISKDCGECSICKNECPAMAIHGVNYRNGITREEMYDAKACSEFMKSKFQHIGRGSVCGICISKCPENLKKY